MSEIEGGGGSVESGGSGEVSSSSEVSETSSAETGGESSEATQEATTEEAGESGGFDEDSDTTESPEDSAEDSDESEYDEEPDDSQEVGFSESDDVDNPDPQNDESEYEDSDSSDADENGVGFDDSDDDGDIDNDGEPDDANNETETDNIDDDQDEGDYTEDPDSTADGDEANDDVDSEDDFEDQDNEDDLGEPEDYSGEDTLDDFSDGDETNDDVDGDGNLDDADSDAEVDTEDDDNIDGDQDEGDYTEDPDSTADADEANDDVDGDGNPDDTDSDTEADTEDDDNIDDNEDDGDHTEDPDSTADGDEANDDVDGDGNPDDADSDTEADTEDDDNIDGDQDDGDHTEDPDSTADPDEANDDADGDGNPDDADSDTEADTEDDDNIDDDYDEDEDPGEVEQYSDEDLDSHAEDDDSTDEDSEAEREEAEEQAVEEENEEAAGRAENETENADAVNTVKNGEDGAEAENQNLSENATDSQDEPVTPENSNNEVDTENDATRADENNTTAEISDTQNEAADNNEDNSGENRDQNKEQPEDTNAKLDNKAENPDSEDAYRTAMNNMADYMNEHNYGPDDYAEYSKDPEWQKLNADVQQSLGMEVTTDTATSSLESGKDVSATELPDNCVMVNASDIDMTYAQGMDSDQFWNHHGNTKEDYMRVAEKIPDVQQALDSGKSLDEIRQDPDLKDTANAYFDPENMIKVEQQADGSYSFTDDGRHRIAAAQELGYEIPVEVTNKSEGFSENSKFEQNDAKERIDGMAYTQGNNDLGYEGTCGPTSLSNSLNRVTGTDRFSENEMVKTAADNNLCCTSGPPENCGGTSTKNIVELVGKVTVPEDNITTEVYEYDNALSVDELADKLKDSNTVAMVGVDSSTLWDNRGDVTNSSLFGNVESDYSDHWIMVDKPVYGEDGKLEGFNIVDSGGGESYVDRDKFEAMYIGNQDFQVKDPTSIIISKNESTPGELDTTVQPEKAAAMQDDFIAEETDLPPPDSIADTEDTYKNADNSEGETEIPTKDISEMPENVQRSYGQYENAGWPNVPKLPEQTPGTHASGTWQNRNGDLPRTTGDGTPITYREHDVNDKNPGSTRDAQRFVTGSDGSVYYTDDHYSTFTKLK